MPAVLIPLGVLAVFAVMYGLGAGAQILTGSSDATEQGGIHGWLNVLEKTALLLPTLLFKTANKAFSSQFTRWAAAHMPHVTAYLNGLRVVGRDTMISLATFSEATAQAIERIVAHTIPHAVTTRVAPVARAARDAARDAARGNAAVKALDRRLSKLIAKDARQLARVAHAADVTLPRALGKIRTAERAAEGEYRDLRKRVGAIENGAVKTFDYLRAHPFGAAMGVFTGLVSIALAKLGYSFLRCRDWQNLGRQVKCSDANLLSQLLADATLALGVVSLVELAREEQAVIGDLASLVRQAWDVG